VSLDVEIKHMGSMTGMEIFGEFGGYYGDCITVSVVNRNIDIVVANTNQPFVERHQFEAAGVDWDDYDLVVVKIGYAFPELKEHGSMCIMSLTQGATLQDTASLPFKLIMRPMFPIDKI
jgi:microcystin degradation protein MlrC